MLVQADFGSERFVAQLARERPLAVVRPPRVHLQAVRRREHLVALDARVHVAERRAPHQRVMVPRMAGRTGVRAGRRRGGQQRLVARAGRELLSQLHHLLGRGTRRLDDAAGRVLVGRVEWIRRGHDTCKSRAVSDELLLLLQESKPAEIEGMTRNRSEDYASGVQRNRH